MKKFAIVLLCTIFRISNGKAPFKVQSSGVFQLELFKDEKTYVNAQDFCKSQNSWLAEIKTQELQQDVETLMGNLGAWIGGKYTSYDWKWGDGSKIVYENWSDAAKYARNTSRCIEIDSVQKWTKIRCGSEVRRRFICQSVRQAIVVFPTKELRFFTDNEKDFDDAAVACQRDLTNGHLVYIKTDDLDDRITNELTWRKAVGIFLCGGDDKGDEGNWKWGDRTEIDDSDREKWGRNEPDGLKKQNCLGKEVNMGWKWIDVICNTQASYICERDLQDSACSRDICSNRGSCSVWTQNGISAFHCECDNFIGRMCEIDPCDPTPCPTNAYCSRQVDHPYFVCTCFGEYRGDDCEARKYTTIGSCTYHLNQREIVTAQAASNRCTEDDASLAILASIPANEEIKNEIARLYSDVSFWIGAKKDTDWHWYDGTRVDSLALPGTLQSKCLKLRYSSRSTSLVPAYCLSGIAGFICEKPVGATKPCASRPCSDQGTCNNFGCHFKCNCKNGYDGKTCDQNRMTVSITSRTFTAHKGEKLTIALQIETEDFPVDITYCKGLSYEKTAYTVKTKTTSKLLGPFGAPNAGIECEIEVSTTSGGGYTRTKSITIVVVAPAKVSVTEESVAIPVSVTKTIYCDFSGQPTPDVQWYKDDQPVPRQSTPVYQVPSTTYYRLVITKQAGEADAGNYTCRATNNIEMDTGLTKFTDEKTTYLRVAVQALSVDGRPGEIYVEEAQLSCKYKANPRPSITWQLVRGSETIDISESETGSIFKISTQSIDDQVTPQEMSTMHVKLVDCLGTVEIKCVAKNQFDTESSEFQLNERVKLLGNRQFIFSKNDDVMTRDSAAKFCANMNASLATIPDDNTQKFLKKHSTYLHSQSSHVGGKAFEEGGSRLWRWPNGNLFYNETKHGSWRSDIGNSVDGAYVAWYNRKPVVETGKDCLHLMLNGLRRWGNALCSWKMPSICEKTAQGTPVIQSAKAANCAASIDVHWKPSTKAVRIKHRIEVTPAEKGSAIIPNPVDVVTEDKLYQHMFRNLSFATKYNVTIYVCPDYCSPECHSAEQVVTGAGLPEKVRKANVSQEDDTSFCTISWTKPVNDFGILSYQITAKSKVVYFSSEELEKKTFDDKVQHTTLTHLQHSYNASANRAYAFTVQARTCAGLGRSVKATGKCKTKRSAPSLIITPKPSLIGEDGTLDISMPPIDETNGPISCLLVVVVSDPESDDAEGHKYDQERLGKASLDAGQSQGKEYISLALSSTDLSDRMSNGSDLLLKIGDNTTTSCDSSQDSSATRQRRAVGKNTTFQGRNTPLDKNNKVGIVVVTATPLGGGNIAYQSSDMAEYGGSDNNPILSNEWIAAVVVGIIVVIIAIVVVMFLLKRRQKKTNDERPDRSHVPMESIVPSSNNEPLYANLTNDAADLRSDTDIPIERLESVYNSLKANKNKGFQEEYQELKNAAKTIVFPKEAASRASLKKKNRYKNILPYDNTRVKLLGDGSESYINASYIKGFNQPNKFIATQGPLPITVNDFWKMVVEKNCKTIVMLTKCFEKGKKKCEQYWPNPGETKQYGKITIQNQSEASFGSFLDTTLKVSGGGHAETIHHFQLLKWPDHGFPVTTSGFFRLHGAVSSFQTELGENAPIVVHCSAGAGRTGAFIAYDYLNDERQNLNRVDVYNCVLSMRKQRVDMVQNCDQYIFVYKLLLEDYLFGTTQMNGNKAASIMREPDVEARISEEFNNLSLMEPIHAELHGAHQEMMNRKKNLVPYEHAKVVITRVGHELDTPYINASFVETYNDSYEMIAAQGPVEASIENFWRAAFDNDVTIIVALTRCTEGNKEQCAQYWPTEVGESMQLHHISVEMRTQYLDGNIVIREMHVTKEKEAQKIMQYHYKGWSAASCPSNPTEILDLVNKMQKAIHPRGKLTVLVHCSSLLSTYITESEKYPRPMQEFIDVPCLAQLWLKHGPNPVKEGDGAGRTGAFCAIVNLIERLNSENVVDVFREVKDLRDCRPGMVQTLSQYRFCYQTIETYMAATSVYSNFDVGNEETVYENL